ncbi:rhomboid family intramembrane serine protease [uncultured Roseovarius sp.]|uniref:rhomboid family intramembrane serine protease n=1 Tax=uncultured Roseovarius sp. TaxID=293344 RepID=UPI00263835F3|nr:rhomboid family intramembrane serine protease [uncultured Roseovarius sp.]
MSSNVNARFFWSPVIFFLVLSSTLIELVLQGADAGIWGSARLRILTYQNTAFYPGLLGGWIPNYELQPYVMFLSYAVVHGGLVHLVVNMVTLIALGSAVVRDVGDIRFILIYLISAFAGACVFAILTTSFRPMVGASGALSGLAGALIYWNIRYAFRQKVSAVLKISSILWPLGILLILNVLMYYGFDKNVAWETHLGGTIGGFVAAIFMRTDDMDEPVD